MKRLILPLLGMAITSIVALMIMACSNPDDGIMSKEKGMYVVNTTKLTQDVTGFNGTTPLKIFIKSDKIVKIEALPNEETPSYFEMVTKGLLNKWDGMSIQEALNAKVDAITGATYSSDAVKENVRIGVNYYKEHK